MPNIVRSATTNGEQVVITKEVRILTDEPVKDGKLGFNQYASSLVSIIMGSEPQFTIGIFGGWGTGKTTLMQMMYEKLKEEDYKENVVSVWFNAWLYEREKYLAIVPLLNTILIEISARPELNTVRNKIIEALKSFFKATEFSVSYPGVPGVPDVSVGHKPEEAVKNKEDTLYYDKFKQIEIALDEVNKKKNKKKDLRIVVFIDDLDRCAPNKVLEIFESIKIFLGISGFIYVLGLSQKVIEECINKKYKDLKVEGSDYVKKIIQIPFRIPEWREKELIEYVESITKQLDNSHEGIFSDRQLKELIINGLEKNPREVKRFINSYIVTKEVFKGLDSKTLLLLQIFQFRWPIFYDKIFDFENFCEDVKKYIENQSLEGSMHKQIITEHDEAIKFLQSKNAKEMFIKLTEMNRDKLNEYRRAGMAVGEGVIRSKVGGLMTNEEIDNAILHRTSLEGANLSGFKFKGQNLSDMILKRAIMNRACLEDTNLYRANLNEAELMEANLQEANLGVASLERANLQGANLQGTNLQRTNLQGTNLQGANLQGANLQGANLQGANLQGAKFDEACIQSLVASIDWEHAKFDERIRKRLTRLC